MTATPAVTVLAAVQVEAARATDRRALRNYFEHLDEHIGPRVHDLCVDPGWDRLSIEEQFAAVARVIVNELETAQAEFLDGRDYYAQLGMTTGLQPPHRAGTTTVRTTTTA